MFGRVGKQCNFAFKSQVSFVTKAIFNVRFKNVKTAILLNKCHISGQLFRNVYCRIAKKLECLILSLVNYHIGSQVCVLSVEANFFSSLSRYGCCLVNVWVVCKLFFLTNAPSFVHNNSNESSVVWSFNDYLCQFSVSMSELGVCLL